MPGRDPLSGRAPSRQACREPKRQCCQRQSLQSPSSIYTINLRWVRGCRVFKRGPCQFDAFVAFPANKIIKRIRHSVVPRSRYLARLSRDDIDSVSPSRWTLACRDGDKPFFMRRVMRGSRDVPQFGPPDGDTLLPTYQDRRSRRRPRIDRPVMDDLRASSCLLPLAVYLLNRQTAQTHIHRKG
jgi:hypothetical protein